MPHSVTVDVKKTRNFCDDVYTGLADMRQKAVKMRGYVHAHGASNDVIAMYERHLGELIETIDWKIQILAHSCPHDWKGSAEFENDVQVDAAAQRDRNFSPGYTGG